MASKATDWQSCVRLLKGLFSITATTRMRRHQLGQQVQAELQRAEDKCRCDLWRRLRNEASKLPAAEYCLLLAHVQESLNMTREDVVTEVGVAPSMAEGARANPASFVLVTKCRRVNSFALTSFCFVESRSSAPSDATAALASLHKRKVFFYGFGMNSTNLRQLKDRASGLGARVVAFTNVPDIVVFHPDQDVEDVPFHHPPKILLSAQAFASILSRLEQTPAPFPLRPTPPCKRARQHKKRQKKQNSVERLGSQSEPPDVDSVCCDDHRSDVQPPFEEPRTASSRDSVEFDDVIVQQLMEEQIIGGLRHYLDDESEVGEIVLQSISVMTKDMRDNARRYPDVVSVDFSSGTNKCVRVAASASDVIASVPTL